MPAPSTPRNGHPGRRSLSPIALNGKQALDPLLLTGVLVTIGVIALVAILIPVASHFATMDAFGLLDEPPVPEGETSSGS